MPFQIGLFVFLPVCLSVGLSVQMSASVYQNTCCLATWLFFTCLSIGMFVCLDVYVSFCLIICSFI